MNKKLRDATLMTCLGAIAFLSIGDLKAYSEERQSTNSLTQTLEVKKKATTQRQSQ